jgi:itaconate CoA-transferase
MGPPGLLKLVSMPNSKVGHATFTFLHGDNEAYRAMANNPRVVMATSKEVNDPAVIATKPNMVAVNTALEIDVFGNTNAERDGDRVLSAPGGQPDFMKGASMAPTGKAIMALGSVASPAGRGKMSTIVIGLKGPTTTPKGSVDYVVTEWGSTQNMRGQSDAVRAQQLVSVAHPAFRGELADAAKQRGLITEAHAQQIKAGVFHALEAAPEEMREAAADLALEKGAITNDQHTHILIELLTPKLAALAR